MAEEDEGMEAFDFDERDLEFALNPGRRHYQTKNQATYGIWADRESDEDEAYDRPSFGKKARKDYSAPINFISGGIKQGSSLDPSDKLKENVRDDAPIEIISKRERKKQMSAGANVFAGAIDPNAPSDWTKFGKGDVIKNIMKSMGYKEGEGLGASRQGIVEPVQATVRKGRAAVGAYGKEAVGPKFGESAAEAQRRLSEQKQDVKVDDLSTPQLKNAWKKAAKVIIPRIEDRVSSWDPLTDSVPIHSWLVPWLAVLGDRLQPVLAPIRQKLAKALRLWNPTDHSAMAILKPWCGVWTAATMSAFLAQNVVPKLEKCLDTMNLNPRENKKCEEWYSCMSWIGMISADTMASIVTKYFFPRWYSALCQWLDSPRVILEEVKMWYREWDARIPPQIRDFPTIKGISFIYFMD
ncbi:g-patch domain protein [Teladorsagia circumcincta]|uniref:G-patch domain protein n=1 Tax=Teladorsagia circumcincta TaxID=45464 RepID=A0A2G9U5G5_TELCI|nr:g-patch domain protein [Teladorsagia circumcincta]